MLLRFTGVQVGGHRFEKGFRESRRTGTFSHIDIVRDRCWHGRSRCSWAESKWKLMRESGAPCEGPRMVHAAAAAGLSRNDRKGCVSPAPGAGESPAVVVWSSSPTKYSIVDG